MQHPEKEPQSWTDRLPALQAKWQVAVGQGPLPWYVQNKFLRGAFATFLGLTISAADEGTVRWRAVAVGDACMLHTRAGQLLDVFPLSRSEQFDNYPNLVGSRLTADYVRDKLSVHACGDAWTDDRFWLMTDALAQWSLAQHETGNPPWETMESLRLSPEGDAEFERWIEATRDAGSLRNDDVTLLAIIV